MIKVEIKRNRSENIEKLAVSGHACMAPKGQDIVCAGVSALVQAAIMGLERHLEKNIDFKQTQYKLTVKLVDEPDKLTEAILETMLLGLWEIAKLYPENVVIVDQ